MQRRRTTVRSTARRKALFAKKKQQKEEEKKKKKKKTVPCPAQKETKASCSFALKSPTTSSAALRLSFAERSWSNARR